MQLIMSSGLFSLWIVRTPTESTHECWARPKLYGTQSFESSAGVLFLSVPGAPHVSLDSRLPP